MIRRFFHAVNRLFSEENKLDIRNIRYLPRWFVLLIDTFLVLCSLILSYFILRDLKITPVGPLSPWEQLWIIISIHFVFLLIFRTYAGLIRHSSNVDAIKLFLACSFSLFVLAIANFMVLQITGQKIFLNSGLVLVFFVSFSLLFVFRLVVKHLYEYFKIVQTNEHLIKAVIIGIDESAISIAAALDIEHPQRFTVQGFASKSHNKRLRILDKPVVGVNKEMIEAIKKLYAEAIILSGNTLTAEERFSLVEQCLENDIKVYNSPLVINWGEHTTVTNQLRSLQIEDLLDREPIVLNRKNKERQLSGKTVLVTGGAGSIGSEIVRQVAGYNPKKLIVLDQAETPLHNMQLELNAHFPDLNIECVICDVANRNRLGLLFKANTIDVIYHAAAYKHVPLMEDNPSEAIVTNVYGTKNLADLAVIYNVSHFVMVSTDKAVNPTNVMGASKRAAEMYVQSRFFYEKSRKEKGSSTKFITTRFGNVLGSNGSVVPLFKKQIEKGGPVTITHPDIIRYFMTIPEACQLVLEAGAMGVGGEIFIFDMGEPVKIMSLAEKMIKLAGHEPHKDIKIKITGLRPGEKLYEELLSDESKSLPTHHEKIMISRDVNQDFDFVSGSVNSLIKAALQLKNKKTVERLKKLVPEFKSNNSEFECLDIENDLKVVKDDDLGFTA
ncbi:polysaccharide biosynthesis protein [Croceiramulus getboli]|nr:nucleoside-diphosphate sugar epimerase/dehydratase [Flavobacteriaceae bacterium YJPT1-3]